MGLEEVSELNDLSVSMCNLELCKPNMKDANASGKESSMKINGKKRIFALLMCAMMIVSSMSVWAGYASQTIGGTTRDDQALCELYLSSTRGQAFTTPNSSSMSVSTEVVVMDGDGNKYWGYGSSVATVTRSDLYAAGSNHYAGPYFISLGV